MINVHSHTRTLEILKPYQASTWLDHDHGSTVTTTTPRLLYVPREQSIHGVLRQDSCHHYLVTYLSTQRRKKSRSVRQGTFEDRHAKEKELHQPPSSRSVLSHRRPGASTSHFSHRNQALPCQREAHTKIYRPSPRSLQDEE